MRLLVLGGTVYLSKTVAAHAVARGHDVTVATRGKTGEAPDGVTRLTIDRSTPEGLEPLRGKTFDAVVDVTRFPDQVQNTLEALAGNVGHWTFVSTCSVYNDDATPGQTPATALTHEPTPDDSGDPAMELFGPSKVSCENQIRDRLGDKAFIVRPGLIVGPGDRGDRFGYWPRRIAEGGEMLAPGDSSENIQYIDVRDLADWILDAAENGTTGTYDAICPPISRGAFLDQIATALDADVTFTWVPQDLLTEHEVAPWMGEQSLGLWLPLPEYAGFMNRDVTASVAAGMKIRPLGETALAWRDAAGPDPALRAGITREKESEILAAFHKNA
ncbi:NAD-dependent epimerase/dehydratase family protein [Phytomonospora sp. NPDC050363]|uniref:NAD-dependent epimerase/dehydratase family protein n=1 Tax=Phytomonospora sp. NPDC050363 TaxID=3155642 RepID=UPI0033ED2A94